MVDWSRVSGIPQPCGGAGLPSGTRTVLVLGASRSGIGAALALSAIGVDVVLSDRRAAETLDGLEEVLRQGVRRSRTRMCLRRSGRHPGLVIKSPGVPAEAGPVQLAREHGVPVLEASWSWLMRSCPTRSTP